jgi:hypothetical protein
MPSTSVLTMQQDCCSFFFSIAHSAYSFDLVFDGIWVESFSGSPSTPFGVVSSSLSAYSSNLSKFDSTEVGKNIDQDSLPTSLYWLASPFCQDMVKGASNATRNQTQAL